MQTLSTFDAVYRKITLLCNIDILCLVMYVWLSNGKFCNF